ncbi:NACHT, LRR and PYD domains-containing protein 12 isoform X12 [Papio anubis]|uniref:NACHT, LRR and PYD domains-containing protein 12 isoform X12 n=1 Tax=Papio anubis TaxID=9555 RepID=UPI0012AE6987|nr:NACHT, LRR and PYD domains-containing protein 12 isoform X12 [Papio anubis]
MLRTTGRDGLCRLSAYLEELEAVELKKFKLYLGTATELGEDKIPWGRMEMAGPLEMAHLLITHFGTEEAWRLALSTFERMNRKDLWERGQREDLVRDTPPGGPSSLGNQSTCLLEASPVTPRKDPQEAYRDYVRRKFRLMEDRNARLGECVNLSHRYTRLLLVKEHSNPMQAQQQLLDIGRGHTRTVGHQASPIKIETLFEPDEERPEPPRTVVMQGVAGIGKSMLAHKVMLDWADGKLFQGRFDYLFYINCREMNQSDTECSMQDLISSCWPEPSAPLQELVRVPERLLFIIDGFDELKPSFHDPQGPWCLCWAEKRPTELLLNSLIRKKLLPELSLLVTTRPTALEKLHRLLEQHPRHVEILGFSEAERKEYFYKYFHDTEQAGQVFNYVRDNEPLFTMCFVPLVCWVVCTCLQQQLEGGGLLRQTSRTTTAVYMLYLLSLMQPKLRTPRLQPPPNQRGLCSLAADGLWNQKILFEEQDLRKHGLDGADVSAFLNMNIFQKDINCERYYSFIHLSFQEFFAAMYYILDDGERGAGPDQDVIRLLTEYGFSERSFLALTIRFLFGLLNEETRSYLENSLCWKVSPHIKRELLQWIRSKAQSDGSTLQQGSLEFFSCLYEIQEEEFIQQALSHFQVIVVSNIASKMEHMVCSFCVKNCRSAQVLHLYGATYSADGEDRARCSAGAHTLLVQLRPERTVLLDAYSEHLAAALCTNPNLVELSLYRNALGSRGVKLLCQGLRHPSCKLQNLRLKRCRISSSACEDLSAALIANKNLTRMDLSGNGVGFSGMTLLCEGLRHPQCRLQMIQLDSCGLTAKACKNLYFTLGINQTLTELYLTNNALGDTGVRLLCKRLNHPGCKLRVLWLFGMDLNKMTHSRLAALRVTKPYLDIGC